MKRRIVSGFVVLLAVLSVSAVSPALIAFPFSSSSGQSWFTASLATAPQTNQKEPIAPGPRLESLLVMRETSGTLFENVVAALRARYYDEHFRSEVLPKLASEYTDKASHAATLEQQREVVEEFLSHIPSSHLGLLSRQGHRYLMYDLEGRAYPNFGFQLVEIKGMFYAHEVLEGGPAEHAGVLSWDRIVSIDGVPVERSTRVDWRSDDAYIPDDRDPPVHYVLAERGDKIQIKVERKRGKYLSLTVPAEDYSPMEAARASTHVYNNAGHSVGYMHFWYVHLSGVPELIKKDLENDFNNCAALIVDLRGRGGNAAAIPRIVELLRNDKSTRHRPIVALVDRQSRSAKDVLAYLLKSAGIATLVGEPTAGAVIPASFADVGHDSVLMLPTFRLPRYTNLLESKPVQPDVFVERAGPFSEGKDPILKAGLSEAIKLLKVQHNQ